jgi:hypothetical protein
MRAVKGLLVAFVAVSAVAAQSPEPPLADSRLTVHTLVREDIFAGFMSNDMNRFERGERNIELLFVQRPDQQANLLAWKGSASVHRAVLAHEAGKADEFQRYFQIARDSFAEAAKIPTGNEGVAAITGGTLSVFADRLPQEHRASAWAQAFEAYSLLYKQQGDMLDKLPVHHRGEVIGGLAQAAQRTGRNEEAAQYVERMLVLMQGTPYEATAKQWKADPASAAITKLTCKNCHNAGRLSSRLTELNK